MSDKEELAELTAEAREAYAMTSDGLDFKSAAREREAAFDRWLTRVRAEAAAEALEQATQIVHDWASLHAGPEGAYSARIIESRLRERAEAYRKED